jgi:hypothetical protein
MTAPRLSEAATRAGRKADDHRHIKIAGIADITIADIALLPTIDVPTAGRVLGIGRDAAYAAVKRGEIPVLSLGRSLRCPVPKLLAVLGITPETTEAPQLQEPERFTLIKPVDATPTFEPGDYDTHPPAA